MATPPGLQPGSLIRCFRRRRFHPLIKPYAEGTDYARAMLFAECRGGRFYVGQEGDPDSAPQFVHHLALKS